MVIIRVNANINNQQLRDIMEAIHGQAQTDGVIVLPRYCDLLHKEPGDAEIQITSQGDRVAELEAELAAAMEYINAQRDCSTCKQYDTALTKCDNVCSECKKEDCFCRTCHNGSKWEWRG